MNNIIPISSCAFSLRALNCLNSVSFYHNFGFYPKALNELSGLPAVKLLRVRNLGRKTFKEIIEACKHHGIEMDMTAGSFPAECHPLSETTLEALAKLL